jgi:zinc transporter
MGDAVEKRERPPVKDWMSVVIFDGRGGVKRLTEEEEAQPYAAPQKGFVLVAGNSRSPDFKVWLREELGDFNSDMLSVPSTRTRCVVLEDKAMVVLRVPRPNASPDDVGRQLLSLWLEKGRVIVSWQQSHHAPLSPADLVARLGLRAADRMEPLIERLGDNLDSIEENIMADRKVDVRSKLSHLRRNLISFRRLIWPQRDVLNTLEIEDLSFFSPRDRIRLREASSRSARLGDELQALSERAVLVHEQILDTRAEQMNKTMLLLTAVTVILLPLTVISGVLGMNVAGIPFADNPHAFWVVAVLLGIIGLGLYVLMRRVKWL